MTPLTPEPFEDSKTLLERVEDSLLPLINLVFLLLMFFIVAGQLTDTVLPDLPGLTAGEAGEQPEADLVVAEDGVFRVANESVDLASLESVLPAPDDTRTLQVAAAAGTPMGELEQLFRHLETIGYGEVILLTEPVE